MVSLVNTAMPKHVAAPNIADSRYRGEHSKHQGAQHPRDGEIVQIYRAAQRDRQRRQREDGDRGRGCPPRHLDSARQGPQQGGGDHGDDDHQVSPGSDRVAPEVGT